MGASIPCWFPLGEGRPSRPIGKGRNPSKMGMNFNEGILGGHQSSVGIYVHQPLFRGFPPLKFILICAMVKTPICGCHGHVSLTNLHVAGRAPGETTHPKDGLPAADMLWSCRPRSTHAVISESQTAARPVALPGITNISLSCTPVNSNACFKGMVGITSRIYPVEAGS